MKKTIAMRRGVIALLFFVANVNAVAQKSIFEYYRLERKARIFKEQNSLDSSLVYYMKAVPLNPECPVSVLESALKVSKKLKNDEISASLKGEITKQKSKFNPEYYKEIKRIFKEDQRVRSNRNMRIKQSYIDCSQSKNCDDKLMAKYLKVLNHWHDVDSSNITELISLINRYDFPSENVVGRDGYLNARAIMLHFDNDKNNVILGPILENALKSGKIKPLDYAWIIDRREMDMGRRPFFYHIPTIQYQELSLEEKEAIDQKRQEIGLNKIKDSQIITRTKNGFRVKYID